LTDIVVYAAAHGGEAVNGLAMFVKITIGILVFSAMLGWGAFRAAKSADRSSRDPRYRRRQLLLAAAMYAVFVTFGILEIVVNKESPFFALCLTVPLLFLWRLWRAANRVGIPPESRRTQP
jgi:hypothetical protein